MFSGRGQSRRAITLYSWGSLNFRGSWEMGDSDGFMFPFLLLANVLCAANEFAATSRVAVRHPMVLRRGAGMKNAFRDCGEGV
jgi:hypothetical protein